jgi:hypothetical protein
MEATSAARGNLEKKQEINQTPMPDKLFMNFVWNWIVPPFNSNVWLTGFMLAGISLLLIACWLVAKAKIGIKRLLWREVPPSSSDAAMSIWFEMCKV